MDDYTKNAALEIFRDMILHPEIAQTNHHELLGQIGARETVAHYAITLASTLSREIEKYSIYLQKFLLTQGDTYKCSLVNNNE